MAEILREVAGGSLRGELMSNGTVGRFLGVSYGGDVSGSRRFRPAALAEPWSGVRDCLHVGPAAPQPAFEAGAGERAKAMQLLLDEIGTHEAQDENCLVLNVWFPAGASGARPVMVWIHGGGHTIGSGAGATYDGAWLAEHHDVVVVTVNHRLGMLGYLYLGELLGDEYATSGNVGNLDIVTALEWVSDNIAAFGGDPGNVTIFGESGGGAKVSALLAMPAAAGLLHRAIIQSGPKLAALPVEFSAETARVFLGELGVGAGDAHKLFNIPAAVLIDAQLRTLGGPLGSATVGGRPLGPTVDGVALPVHPFEPGAPAISAGVPLLIGTNKDEMTLFSYPNQALDALDEAGTIAAFKASHGDRAEALYTAYRQCRPDATPAQRLTQMMTDRFRVGSIRLAERKSAQQAAPAWMYRFDFETDVLDGALGAPHAMEMAYVFGVPDAVQLSGRRSKRHHVAATISAAWAAFARNGNPQTAQLPAWPAYTAQDRHTMIFDNACHIVQDPDSTERQAWDGLTAGV